VTGDVEIGLLTAGRLAEAAALLARAFREDPGHVHLYPDPAARERALPHEFAAACRDGIGLGHVQAASAGGRLAGVAVWLPPGGYPMTIRRQLRVVPDAARLCLASPGSFARLVRYGSAVERAHPPQPYWYLEVLGVEPALQGLGIGTRLLRPVLDAADRARLPCYLETDTEANVRWYRGRGFEVRAADLELSPGGPPFWTMLRPPR
jgi:GNAT superfamily N-acetyltransferase